MSSRSTAVASPESVSSINGGSPESGLVEGNRGTPEAFCLQTIGSIEVIQEDRVERFLEREGWNRLVGERDGRPYQLLLTALPDGVAPDALTLSAANCPEFRSVTAVPSEGMIVMRLEGEDVYTDDLAMVLAINDSLRSGAALPETLRHPDRLRSRQSRPEEGGAGDSATDRTSEAEGVILPDVTWRYDMETLQAYGVEPAEVERARDALNTFSHTEREVLPLIDRSQTLIAEAFGVSKSVMRSRVLTMLHKAGVERHGRLLLLAFQAGALSLEPSPENRGILDLTERQTELVRLSLLTAGTIAHHRGCRVSTVNSNFLYVRRRANVHSRVELMAAAIRYRVLRPGDFQLGLTTPRA